MPSQWGAWIQCQNDRSRWNEWSGGADTMIDCQSSTIFGSHSHDWSGGADAMIYSDCQSSVHVLFWQLCDLHLTHWSTFPFVLPMALLEFLLGTLLHESLTLHVERAYKVQLLLFLHVITFFQSHDFALFTVQETNPCNLQRPPRLCLAIPNQLHNIILLLEKVYSRNSRSAWSTLPLTISSVTDCCIPRRGNKTLCTNIIIRKCNYDDFCLHRLCQIHSPKRLTKTRQHAPSARIQILIEWRNDNIQNEIDWNEKKDTNVEKDIAIAQTMLSCSSYMV